MGSRVLASALAVAAALQLAAPGVAAAKDKAPVKVENAKALAELQTVTLASFNVAFVTQKTDAAFAGARNLGKAMGAISKATLAGVSPADFQAVADAAYADFTAKLTAAGYTLGDRPAMIADKQMAKVQYVASGAEGTLTTGKDSSVKAVFYGPSAFGPTPLMKGETGSSGLGKMGGMFGALSQISAMGGPAVAKGYYAAFNKTPVMTVTYVIDFADVDRYGGRYAVQASVGMKASVAVVEDLSVVTTTNAKGLAATLTLAQPVPVAGNFGTLADTTTTGQSASNAAGAAIGALFGSGSNTYKYVTFNADAPAYRDGAIQAAVGANQAVVSELAARR